MDRDLKLNHILRLHDAHVKRIINNVVPRKLNNIRSPESGVEQNFHS